MKKTVLTVALTTLIASLSYGQFPGANPLDAASTPVGNGFRLAGSNNYKISLGWDGDGSGIGYYYGPVQSWAVKFSNYHTGSSRGWVWGKNGLDIGGLPYVPVAALTIEGVMQIKSDFYTETGKIGIKTTTPQTALDVNGDSHFNQNVGIKTLPDEDANLAISTSFDDAIGLKIQLENTSGSIWGVDVFSEVAGQRAYTITNSATGVDIFHIYGNGEMEITTGQNSNDKPISIKDYTTGDDVFRVMDDGTVYATTIKVMQAQNFPDYVFNKNYQLMNLGTLEKYITINQHLPNMPSAEQVEKEGADLAEINRVLVEKVEELTLYLIDINKRIKELEIENEKLTK